MKLDPKALEVAAEWHDHYGRRNTVGALNAIRNSREIITAYLSTIAETHVVVPREPTRDMLTAFVDADTDIETAAVRYAALLAASQQGEE